MALSAKHYPCGTSPWDDLVDNGAGGERVQQRGARAEAAAEEKACKGNPKSYYACLCTITYVTLIRLKTSR
jgi:hypothetical protein